MSKKDKQKVVLEGADGETLDLELKTDVEGDELDTEEETTEAGEGLGDLESDEDDEEEAAELDWKTARAVLKEADKSCGYSIDEYERRYKIEVLRTRFNEKERSQSLYDEIMAL